MQSYKRIKNQLGLSLVELMVSLTIGLIIIIVIGYVYLSASNTFRSLEAASRIQENIRYAFERISNDIRMSGYTGCSQNTTANVLNPTMNWTTDLFKAPLLGYEDNASTFPSSVTGRLRGDAITIIKADNSAEYTVDTFNSPSEEFQLTENHDLKQGEILVITDCNHSAVFQMTNNNVNNTIKVVGHSTGNSVDPGNCTKGLGYPVDCSSVNGTTYPFPKGSKILRMQGHTYYIKANSVGEPALYRETLGTTTNNASTTALELIDGIEDMQILYGVDTDATADGGVNIYMTADQVNTVATPGTTKEERWARVLSVQINLLAVSTSRQLVNTKLQPYTFNGIQVSPTDLKMRKSFTTTVALRNRL